MTLLIIAAIYLAISGVAYGVYYVWSRKTPEYASARSFEDFIAAVACFGWPIAIPILLVMWARKPK